MSYLCPHCNSFPLGNNWWCAICGEKHDWKQPDRLLVVQTSENVNQAKVFNAHAVPQGLCENLFIALKLLANQQEDGDGFMQNIVTNLGEESRKGLTEGLRNFIQVDNHRALEVGYRNKGMGNFLRTNVKRIRRLPRGDGHGKPRRIDASGRGSGYVEVIHQCRPRRRGQRWSSPLVDHDWYAFCQTLYKGIEGEDWRYVRC